MADIVPVGGGGHGSSPSKKKNKKMLFMAGGVGVVVLLVLLQKSKSGGSGNVDTLQNTIPISDSQRLDNFQSIMTGETNAQITGAMKEAQDGWSDMFKDFSDKMTNQMKEMDDRNKELAKQQQDWVKDSFTNMKDNLGIGGIKHDDDPLWTVGSGGNASSSGAYESGLDQYRNDRGKLKQEIERTKSVMEYRKNNGMSTADQEAHMKRLEGL